jgi:L-threonylcarbamoyladenylate synthase
MKFFLLSKLEIKKASLLLKEGSIGVIPTDTIYGIVGSALDKDIVQKIYKLKRRSQKKPMIILISSIKDISKFNVKITSEQKKVLKDIWPGKVSVILDCEKESFKYLHRGTKKLAFRMPRKKILLEILKKSGPLVAPSANWEGYPPATKISEGKKYFSDKVFYLNGGILKGKPSTLISFNGNNIKIERFGSKKIKI